MIKHSQPEFHFLLTSAFTWQTGSDLHALMKQMDKRKEGAYLVWYVPGLENSTYEIDTFEPQVPGAFVLAKVEPTKKG
jgi:hypothetical protein